MRLILAIISIGFSIFATPSLSSSNDVEYLVLGTIRGDTKGVALLKDMRSKRVWAAREGDKIRSGLTLLTVKRRKAVFLLKGKLIHVRVGNTASAYASHGRRNAVATELGGLQRNGDNVVVSERYKDHLVKNELNKILMQAAAVPNIKNGKLEGFTLWEISPDSIFEKLGFRNGDTVTSINGTKLVDAGQAIRVLTSLKQAKNLVVDYQRGGSSKQVQIKIQ